MWILSPGDVFAGRYRIVREIGSGGMSYVFAAEDEELHENVALKIIRPDFAGEDEFVSRFKHEVRIARQIRHPNIVQVLEFGSANIEGKRLYYLTMELLEGKDLGESRSKKLLPLADTLRIGMQVCDALTAAHRMGVIHRDIKPQNIFIERGGRVKLMDFGISRLATLPSVTTGGHLVGTPKYMSPEQVHRKQEPDHRCDIYSLGVVLYEMTTTQTPFDGTTTVEVALKHVQEPPPRPTLFNPRLPPEVEAVILKCLEKNPDDRYASADELRLGLQAVPSSYEPQADRSPETERTRLPATAKSPVEAETATFHDTSQPAARVPEPGIKPRTVRARVPGSLKLPLAMGITIAFFALVAGVMLMGRPAGEAPVPERPAGEVANEPSGSALPDPQATDAQSEESVPDGGESAGEPAPVTVEEPPPPPQTAPPRSTPPAPAPAPARLAVTTTPPGAALEIDGRPVGTTPWRGELPPGSTRLVASAPGYVTAMETVELEAGARASRDLRLTAVAHPRVRFSSNPQTDVYVDGELLGTIPPNLDVELAPGPHEVRYVMPEYAEHTERIQVGTDSGQVFSHRFPVPGSVRVSAQPYALVRIDGKELGFTPVRVDKVSEGEHVLVLEREGFERIEQTIVVKPFEINRFQYELTPIP